MTMRPPPELAQVALFDSDGRHLGGMYEPIALDGRLTGAHAVLRAARPAERLIFHNERCQDPITHLGLVWAIPPELNPLAAAPDVLGYLVQALDAGLSVKLHAVEQGSIDGVCAAVAPLLGGGHA